MIVKVIKENNKYLRYVVHASDEDGRSLLGEIVLRPLSKEGILDHMLNQYTFKALSNNGNYTSPVEFDKTAYDLLPELKAKLENAVEKNKRRGWIYRNIPMKKKSLTDRIELLNQGIKSLPL